MFRRKADELREVRELFAVERRTEIVDWSGDMEDEDLIAQFVDRVRKTELQLEGAGVDE